MTPLFIELYLDEDVDVLVADLVQARGFKAVTTQTVGRKQKADDDQLAYAANQQLVLVTHNRVDFEELAQEYFAAGKSHSGIIIAVRRDPYEIAQRLLVILNHVTADEMADQIRYI
jgi:predicted nuclease of predicted toxin-antitoxin system